MNREKTITAAMMYVFLITSSYAENPNSGDTARNADVPDTTDILKIDEDASRDLGLPAVIESRRINEPPSLTPPETTFPKLEIDAGRGVKVRPQEDPHGVTIEVPAEDGIPYLKKE